MHQPSADKQGQTASVMRRAGTRKCTRAPTVSQAAWERHKARGTRDSCAEYTYVRRDMYACRAASTLASATIVCMSLVMRP